MTQCGFFLMLLACMFGRSIAQEKRGDVDVRPRGENAEVVFRWQSTTHDFVFPSSEARQQAIESGAYEPKNVTINHLKVFQNKIFVDVQRLFNGVPATLAIVGEGNSMSPPLIPFPSFEAQVVGDCNGLQSVFGFEIDPNTKWIWVADLARAPFLNPPEVVPCPAKLVVYDVNTGVEILRHVFPENVVSRATNALDDLVLDYVDGKARFVYITDTLDNKLVVYDVDGNTSFFIKHPSMEPDPSAVPVVTNGVPLDLELGIHGIAMDFNFKFVLYQPFSGFETYLIPTSVLRNRGENFDSEVRVVARRNFQSDGIFFSSKCNLYLTSVPENAIKKWSFCKDRTGPFDATFSTVETIVQDDVDLAFPTSLSIDGNNLWFTGTNRNTFAPSRLGLIPESDTFVETIWRKTLPRCERSYLFKAPRRTRRRRTHRRRRINWH